MKEEDIPSMTTVVDGFNLIEKASFDNLSYSEKKSLFEKALGIIPRFISPNNTPTASLYRVTNGLFASFNKSQASSFSYPPAANCKIGRANLAGFPVFYAALSGDTALREFRNMYNEPLREGDIVYISEWNYKKGTKATYSQFIYDETTVLGEKIVDINVSNQKKLARISRIYSQEKKAAFKVLIEKIGSLYISDKSYLKSSFLSHYLLYDDRPTFPFRVNALIYPSVQAGFKGINYALHPEFVDQNVILKSIQKVSFISFEDGKSSLSFLELGIPKSSGKITWYTMRIDLKSVKTQKHILVFDEGPLEKISANDILYSIKDNKNYQFSDIIELGWKILNENLEESVNELARFESNINHKKNYKKTLLIKLDKYEIYILIDGIKCKLEGIAFELKYKLILEEISDSV